MHRNLRDYLNVLRRERELVEVRAPVSARLEVAEIHRRVIAAGGPALLFTNVEGARFPLAMNLYGTARRVELGFGRRAQQFLTRLVGAVETLVPPTLDKLWGARDIASTLFHVGMRKRARGAVTEVVDTAADLRELPITTSWLEDGGPFLTLPLVYTEHPGDHRHNLGIYRMQLHDARRLGMHWQIGKGGGFHYHEAEALGAALPVTVFLGGPPALIAAAIAPLPEHVGELLLASLLIGAKLDRVVPGPGPHPLVAEAEFALIGEVPAHERAPEGPFGDHYGYYSLRHDYPVFHLRALAHRRDAIYPATVVGKPRQEDFFLGDYLQELLSPLFPLVMPGVRALWSYGETGYHSLAAAVVRDRYAREAMVSAFRILGEGQLALTKFLLVTDSPRDLRDFKALLEHMLARARFERDLFVFGCLSMDTLDYTGPRVNEGSKGVLLGLGEPCRELPREFRGALPHGVQNAQVYCAGCLVIEGPSFAAEPRAAERIARANEVAEWPLVILADDAVRATASTARFLWTVFTRFEPAADIFASRVELVRNHPAFSPPIVIDARLKPSYPAELFCDPATAATVTRRWREYFPDGGVNMGDSDRGHLG
ncbi:MAG: UbiD family decarboxylase [Planctomycetota bacterium]